jgi:hypothetical protein
MDTSVGLNPMIVQPIRKVRRDDAKVSATTAVGDANRTAESRFG